ncbi:MAG: hypothetical protein QOI11_3499 [Candidatus Eremiobacteraeota bacterium]|nr:hypothetical protein [Candidatus Eremiobacteraeota bacterium]
MIVLDHLVVAAATLDEGARWARERLGADVPAGGKHERLGTHNRVLRLGDALYLEIIAVDPDAPPPGRPRWFELDEPALRAALARAPRLVTWVAASDDVRRDAAACPLVRGPVEPMRRGALEWLITLPPDGALGEGGTLPPLIQWLTRPHPAAGMPELGFGLETLELGHPEPERLRRALAALGLADERVRVRQAEAPELSARIATPRGTVAIA